MQRKLSERMFQMGLTFKVEGTMRLDNPLNNANAVMIGDGLSYPNPSFLQS